MAFRSSATAFSNTGAALTATPAGVQVNDYLCGVVGTDTSGHADVFPTGWTARLSNDMAAPDGHSMDMGDKVAAGGDSFTTGATSDASRWTVGAWSGRDTAAPRTDFDAGQKNTTTASPATISTANATSGAVGTTAIAGDDIAFFSQLDKQGAADTWDHSALSGYTERQDDSDSDWVAISLWSKDNVAGGGEGSLSITATRTGGAANTGWGTIVVAIKAAGVPPPPVLKRTSLPPHVRMG
jgi:hypothetical protein